MPALHLQFNLKITKHVFIICVSFDFVLVEAFFSNVESRIAASIS